MHPKPTLIINKHSIVFRSEALDQLLMYANYFIQAQRSKLKLHREQLERSSTQPSPQDEQTLTELERQIKHAEALLRDAAHLKEQLHHIYRWRFTQLADVLRKTRLQMEQKKIQDIYSLKVVLMHLMQMLKNENPLFSCEQFIQYINEEK